jgi:hypothetical protein
MPAIALDTMAGVTVEQFMWAPNQARVLTAFHAVKADSGSALAEGTQVTYTDPDLGACFVGKITDVKAAYRSGEGVRYTCSDAYRTLTKTPAAIITNGLKETRLAFTAGTSIQAIITAIFNGSGVASVLPGGLNFAITDADTPAVDKGGQGFDTWLNDLLENTPGGIAWVNPNGGSPRLDITDFTAASSVTLTIGSYNIINPISGELLMEGADIGKSLNRKYEKVLVQGCGYFKRYELQYMVATLYASDPLTGMYFYRWYIPDTPRRRILGRYIDADGKCVDNMLVRFKFGIGPDDIALGPMVFDWENPVIQVDEFGRSFFAMQMQCINYFGIDPDWTPPMVSAWLTYTAEEGPMVAEYTSSDPKLAGEGAYIEQHNEFIKYESSLGTIDQSALLTALANALALRYCDAADTTGSVGIHIKGINANLKLGSPITNFSNARAQTISYDLVRRTMNVSISTIPLRNAMKTVKQGLKDGTLEGGNWYQPRVIQIDNCFCEGGTVGRDESGNPVGGHGGKGGKKSYDCDKMQVPWQCVERDGPGGEFQTRDTCRNRCITPDFGWKFIDCQGCVAARDVGDGQYRTQQECLDAHPPGSIWFYVGCKWHCDPGIGCVGGRTGEYNFYADCAAECKQTGSGYGTSSGGVGSGSSAPPPGSGVGRRSSCPCSMALKWLSLGPDGQVLGFGFGNMVPNQEVTVIKDFVQNEDLTFTKTYVTIKYLGDPPVESTN